MPTVGEGKYFDGYEQESGEGWGKVLAAGTTDDFGGYAVGRG